MKGVLDLETLTRRVEAGEIDTVLPCFPDVQGRLLGTRVTGHGVHAGAWEQREYHRRIADWEPIRNFERA